MKLVFWVGNYHYFILFSLPVYNAFYGSQISTDSAGDNEQIVPDMFDDFKIETVDQESFFEDKCVADFISSSTSCSSGNWKPSFLLSNK